MSLTSDKSRNTKAKEHGHFNIYECFRLRRRIPGSNHFLIFCKILVIKRNINYILTVTPT